MIRISIIQAVREYLQTYPPLADSRLNVDFLPEEQGTYSVEPGIGQTVTKRYADGSTVRQMPFVLASRQSFSENILQQLGNLEFYEKFALWLEWKNQSEDLPELDGGREARKIEALTMGYAYIPGAKSARYQIQCRLTYYQPVSKGESEEWE